MKQVYKIGTSDGLNPSEAVLLIEVSDVHCCYAIVNYSDFTMVQFGYYTSEPEDSNDVLRNVVEHHSELQQTFRQTAVSYYTNENVMIPSKFFRYEETQRILQAMYDKGPNIVVTESVPEWQLYNVYHVPAATHGLLSRRFATGNFWHAYSIILKNGVASDEGGSLIVDFKKDNFTTIATRNNTLLLAQIFPYAASADVLYWLVKICTEYSLLQTQVKLTLSGLIDKGSAIFRALHQYFINIDFAATENEVRLSHAFEEYPAHFFSSLYKLAICVS